MENKIEPFTLEWWLAMHNTARHTAELYIDENINMPTSKKVEYHSRYLILKGWILQRIIDKYGE